MGFTSENKPEKQITMGILAHVDAGKTTLSEGILYTCKAIRKLGRVDHQDAFLDTNTLERNRGITIFSKQAECTLGEFGITLLDTPGHVDFSAEMERTLQVLDYGILVIGIPSVSYLPRLEMITGLNITTSIKPMFTIIIFFFTPIIFAAMPTQASRFACKVSSRSLPTERSACVAGSEGCPKKKISLTIYFTILLLLKLFLMFLEKLIKIPHIFQFAPFTTSVIVCVYIINLCIQRSKHKR